MSQPDQAALQARNRLLVLFVLLCVLDVALVILSQDRWAIGRVLLTIGVMYFVLQGRKWAKWLLMGICSLLVVALVAMVVTLRAKLSGVLIVGSLILAILNAIIPIYMARSSDLDRYFYCKRQSYL
jgi:O-antigen ligase